jgi:hypothetical protein
MQGQRAQMYVPIIERIFFSHHREGDTEFLFSRTEIEEVASKLNIPLPANLGDVIYAFRFRRDLPDSILQTAPEGQRWIIRLAGRGQYKFVLISVPEILPSQLLTETKIPDATPGIIVKYSLDDEQALLAKLRYNRLIDIFTGLTCYSLQNHLRTFVQDMGQVESDEIYLGLDKRGVHYVVPVQAKGGTDKIGIVQIEQDFALCSEKFPSLVCRPVAAQFMQGDVIALFEFEDTVEGVRIVDEKHYRLVAPDDLSSDELEAYQQRLPE